MGRILRTFLAGVLALLPIAVTLFVTAWVASLIASYAGPGSFVGRFIKAGKGPPGVRRLKLRGRNVFVLAFVLILASVKTPHLVVEYAKEFQVQLAFAFRQALCEIESYCFRFLIVIDALCFNTVLAVFKISTPYIKLMGMQSDL